MKFRISLIFKKEWEHTGESDEKELHMDKKLEEDRNIINCYFWGLGDENTVKTAYDLALGL